MQTKAWFKLYLCHAIRVGCDCVWKYAQIMKNTLFLLAAMFGLLLGGGGGGDRCNNKRFSLMRIASFPGALGMRNKKTKSGKIHLYCWQHFYCWHQMLIKEYSITFTAGSKLWSIIQVKGAIEQFNLLRNISFPDTRYDKMEKYKQKSWKTKRNCIADKTFTVGSNFTSGSKFWSITQVRGLFKYECK